MYTNLNLSKQANLLELGLFIFLYIVSVILYMYLFNDNLNTIFFYILTITLSCLFSFFSQLHSYKAPSKFWLVLSFLCLFFVLAFRASTGIDDPHYIDIYEHVKLSGPLVPRQK